MTELEQEIHEAIDMDKESYAPSISIDPADSPLNQPVKKAEEFHHAEAASEPKEPNTNGNGENAPKEGFELPGTQAEGLAELFLQSANNAIKAGGGFLVKIKKHNDFFEYAELILVIDEQNEKQLGRLILDEEDKALLRPLLAEILKRRTKILTPEEQLLIAGVSILIKKAQMVAEMRAENKILLERIHELIKSEKQNEQEREQFPEQTHAPQSNVSGPNEPPLDTARVNGIPVPEIETVQEISPEPNTSDVPRSNSLPNEA